MKVNIYKTQTIQYNVRWITFIDQKLLVKGIQTLANSVYCHVINHQVEIQ